MTSRNNEQGSVVHIVVIIVLILVILVLLGFVFWQNFLKNESDVDANTQTASQATSESAKCGLGEDEQASGGTFCSEAYGVKFTIADEFKGQLEKTDNVPIYPVGDTQPDSIGETESVISAKVTRGQYDYSLTISLLPQIDTMSLGFMAGGQFDSNDKKVYAIVSSSENPTFHRGGEYTSINSKNGIKVYRETFGDVGHLLFKSAVITDDKVVVIELKDSPSDDQDLPDETPTVDDEEILASLTLLN